MLITVWPISTIHTTYSYLKSLNTKKTTAYVDGSPGLGQAQKYGEV